MGILMREKGARLLAVCALAAGMAAGQAAERPFAAYERAVKTWKPDG